jgi:hypothetical protein
MLADAGASAVLAPVPLAVMLADAGAPAVLADAPDAVMLADAGASAVLAPAPLAVMLADAGTPAVLALSPPPPVAARPRQDHILPRPRRRWRDGAREAHRRWLRALQAPWRPALQRTGRVQAAGALGAAEGGRAADGLAAHGAGEGGVEQHGAAAGGRRGLGHG